jgi:DNA-binding transcriptional MerR regulator
LSSYASVRHWSADEDRKLLELRQQGVKHAGIRKMLDGRSITAVRHGIAALDAGLFTRKRGRSSAEEDATLLEKRRQGLKVIEITQWLPKRGRNAIQVRAHMLRLTEEIGRTSGKYRRYTEADHQRMIVMRLNERKTLQEVATHFGRS